MVGTAGTNVALRTTVMIGALVILLVFALLPGPIGWLAGAGRQDDTGSESSADGRASRTGSGSAVAGPDGGGFSSAAAERSAAEEEAPTVDGGARRPLPAEAGDANHGSVEERCQQVRRQLRRLGAAYTRLESWESEPCVYRFHCAMPLASDNSGGQATHRTFEAASDSPELAMERVLADVQAWQAERGRLLR